MWQNRLDKRIKREYDSQKNNFDKDDLWASIEPEIDSKSAGSSKKSIILFILLLFISIISFQLFESTNNEGNIAKSNELIKEDIYDASTKEANLDQIKNDILRKQKSQNITKNVDSNSLNPFERSNNISNKSIDKKREYLESYNIYNYQKNIKPTVPNQYESKNNFSNQNTEYSRYEIEAFEVLTIIKNKLEHNRSLIINDSKLIEPIKINNNNTISGVFQIGTHTNFSNYNSQTGSEELSSSLKNSLSRKFGFTGRFLIEKEIIKNWKLQTGLEIDYGLERFEYTENNSTTRSITSDTAFYAIFDGVREYYSGEINITENTNRSVTHQNKYFAVNIPTNLSYEFQFGSNRIQPYFGYTFNIAQSFRGKTIANDLNPIEINYSNENDYYKSTIGGYINLGCNYILFNSNQSELFVGIEYGKHIGDHSNRAEISEKRDRLSLQVGTKFRFRK